MPPVCTVKQIQRLDDIAIHKYGVPSIALMENAGRSVAEEVIRQLKRTKRPRVCVVCGVGNNAGDGFVVARHLLNHGITTDIFLIGRPEQLKQDAAVNYYILNNIHYPIKRVDTKTIASLGRAVTAADITVDAMFGVGLNRDMTGLFKASVDLINAKSKKVVAVDIPSGLDGTTGRVYGACVQAGTTVTFSFAKKGFNRQEGPKHVGKVVVVDIGIPVALCRKIIKGSK